mmetsp:Transcript_21313/g.52507  ORF Transcript_21313/g.52507 Transcript_21313/m.52507 type:complete len:215 (-) Transcript_21313:47-691(-)
MSDSSDDSDDSSSCGACFLGKGIIKFIFDWMTVSFNKPEEEADDSLSLSSSLSACISPLATAAFRCMARIADSLGGTGIFFKNILVSAPIDSESEDADSGFFSNLILRLGAFTLEESRFGDLAADFRFGGLAAAESRFGGLIADSRFGDLETDFRLGVFLSLFSATATEARFLTLDDLRCLIGSAEELRFSIRRNGFSSPSSSSGPGGAVAVVR